MFLGLEWYWWLIILAALVICIPFKVRFMKWWDERQRENEKRAAWEMGG